MRAFLAIFSALIPIHVHAEVMDKQQPLLAIVLWGLLGALCVFLTARFKPWLLLVLGPVVGALMYLQISALMDPYVGPAITTEAGLLYVVVSCATPVLVFVGGCAGFVWRCRKVRVKSVAFNPAD